LVCFFTHYKQQHLTPAQLEDHCRDFPGSAGIV
jgi:hypothetical protein